MVARGVGADLVRLRHARVAAIRGQIAETTSDYDKEKLQERLAKLASGVAIIRVGAPTESEMKEKKDRVEDALNATRAAVEEGIIVGGGAAFLHAAIALDGLKGANDEQTAGIKIVRRAIEEPLRQIVFNAGVDGAVVVNKILESKSASLIWRRSISGVIILPNSPSLFFSFSSAAKTDALKHVSAPNKLAAKRIC